MWGAGQMLFNKILVVYSGDEDLRDYRRLVADAMSRFVPTRDVYIDNGGVSDVLDHSSRRFACGGKMCIDCTGEGRPTDVPVEDNGGQGFPRSIKVIAIKDKLTPVRNVAEVLLTEQGIDAKIIIFVDDGLPLDDYNPRVWYAAGNADPSVDCYVIDNGKGGCLCIDATAKSLEADGFRRDWPEVVMSDDATISSVDNKKIGDLTQSPSIKLRKLRYNNGAVKFFNSSN
jgi:4-hydroxy-3-polyprenylbenzoate decarboxylase